MSRCVFLSFYIRSLISTQTVGPLSTPEQGQKKMKGNQGALFFLWDFYDDLHFVKT